MNLLSHFIRQTRFFIDNLLSSIRKTLHKKSITFRYFHLFLILLFSGVSMGFIQADKKEYGDLQEEIAKEIIRFHVIANSDSTDDQSLKYKVKDALVGELSPILKEADDIAEARKILLGQMCLIQNIAENTIRQNGYDYSVRVTLESCYFPLKRYGNYTFPPGTYEALRVQIGNAKGKNWWCIMFPPLCFVDETYSIVDEDTEEQLKHLLTEEEYESLKDQDVPIKIKFKILESIEKFFQKHQPQDSGKA